MGEGEKEIKLFIEGDFGVEKLYDSQREERAQEMATLVARVFPYMTPLMQSFMLVAINICPNRRVVRLALHGKKRLVRKRNMKRIQKWLKKNTPFDIW